MPLQIMLSQHYDLACKSVAPEELRGQWALLAPVGLMMVACDEDEQCIAAMLKKAMLQHICCGATEQKGEADRSKP